MARNGSLRPIRGSTGTISSRVCLQGNFAFPALPPFRVFGLIRTACEKKHKRKELPLVLSLSSKGLDTHARPHGLRKTVPALALIVIGSPSFAEQAIPPLAFESSGAQQSVADILRGREVPVPPDYRADGVLDAADIFAAELRDAIYRINAGGGAFTDTQGRTWTDDSIFQNGQGLPFTYSQSIANTDNAQLYQSERYDPEGGGKLEYSMWMDPGAYLVRLHFAENFYPSAGQRVFDVFLEDTAVLENLDIAKDVGVHSAYPKDFMVNVYDGTLTLRFGRKIENPLINGIEVFPYLPADARRQLLYRVNCGGGQYVDAAGRTWLTDQGYAGGNAVNHPPLSSSNPHAQTFETSRVQPEGGTLSYGFSVPQPGRYAVRMHFRDTQSTAPGQRVFDVFVEGERKLSNLDIFQRAGGAGNSYATEVYADVYDGFASISFRRILGDPSISGIELLYVGTESITATPELLQWPNARPGEATNPLQFLVTNTGSVPTFIDTVTFELLQGDGRNFRLFYNGAELRGGADDVTYPIGRSLAPGESLPLLSQFVPVNEGDNVAFLRFNGNFQPTGPILAGSSQDDAGHGGHPYLHVVNLSPKVAVDYDGNGSERVELDGSGSHTHEFGKTLTAWEWRDGGGNLIGTGEKPRVTFPVGRSQYSLTIFDSNEPPQSLSGDFEIEVLGADQVPGVYALHYLDSGVGLESIFANPPAQADFGEYLGNFYLDASDGTLGVVTADPNQVTVMKGRFRAPVSGNYDFATIGGSTQLLLVNGTPDPGAFFVEAGAFVELEARFIVTSAGDAPIQIVYSRDGGSTTGFADADLFRDERAIAPVVNSITPQIANVIGGELVTISGIGFLPPELVSVRFGNSTVNALGFQSISPTQIRVPAPAGAVGSVPLVVQSPNGTSKAFTFNYSDTVPVAVSFNTTNLASVPDPTRGAWGPDGRLYIGTLGGKIYAYTFDDNYSTTSVQTITALQSLTNPNILGIAFSPLESNLPHPRIYVAHNKLYANGGFCFSGFSPYSGQISVIEGPDYNTVIPLITGLPVSNHDHGVNGLDFDENGDLLIAVGGNTNAGIPGCNIGGLNESPLSAAILRAFITKPGFNGQVQYQFTSNGQPSNNQVDGALVDVVPGVDVEVFAPGLRNPFDLAFTTAGRIYSVDNGADPGFGDASTGPNTSGPVGDDVDALDWITQNTYYGHPNRNRGRRDGRQNIYFSNTTPSQLPAYRSPLTTFAYSTNAVEEYRSNTFGGAMRGELIAQVWNGNTYRMKLGPNGDSIVGKQILGVSLSSLDTILGPGGVLIGVDYSDDLLKIAKPVDQSSNPMPVYDIFPWRAPRQGGSPFVISGKGFGDLSNTTVAIGGVQAQLTSVSPTRIRGIIPENLTASNDLQNVQVASGGRFSGLLAAFRYMGPGIPDTGAAATIEIDPGSNVVESSSYMTNSFKLKNVSTSGQKITRITFDLRQSLLPDLVFDPFANAGDPVGKNFTVDQNGVGGSISHSFDSFHDGGYDILRVDFTSFDPNEQMTFSIDVDPTSINGAPPPGPNHSGSISGLEMAGCNVAVEFSDGTSVVVQPWREPGSLTGAKVLAKVGKPAAPTLEVPSLGSVPAQTSNASQTIRVFGPVGAQVGLLHAEAALYTAGTPGGGFDIDPFEANTLLWAEDETATVGPEGYVDFPRTLRKTNSNAGFNYFHATVFDGAGESGGVSAPIVIRLN